MSQVFEIVIIGSGPGGYVAAGRAAQLGYKTGLIESHDLGGVCLNWGCIPTKALLDAAHVWELVKNAAQYGIQGMTPTVDFHAVIQRSRQIADRMSKGVSYLMKQRNVQVIHGRGALTVPSDQVASCHQITVTNESGIETILAQHVIIATGGHPFCLPGLQFDGDRILNSTHAMSLTTPPTSLLIVGAGPIGMEFADFYRAFGTDVTVLEMMPTILPMEDQEIITELSRTLRRKKIKTVVDTRVDSISITESGVEVTATDKKGIRVYQAEKLLLAAGVRPNTSDLGLEALGVKLERGFIPIDDHCQTNIPGIYAIGDVTGPPMLAHKASIEALTCVNGIANHHSFRPIRYDQIPGCTYCHPQIASVGLTEKEAVTKGYGVKKGIFPFRANGRSIAMNETEGIVKLLFNSENDVLLGAHILHANASDLIGELGVVLNMRGTAREIADTVHAHPTLSEAVMEAAAAALGEAVHI